MLSNLKPAYTNFLENWLEEHQETPGNLPLEDIIFRVFSPSMATNWWYQPGSSQPLFKLLSMIYNKFYNWELYTLNEDNLKRDMHNIFFKYKDYYKEMIQAYETEIDLLESNKVTRTYEDDTEATPRTQYESKTFDLPRSDPTISRPTTKTQNGGIEGSDTNHGEGTSTIVGGDLLEMKKKYLALIRNLYDEFADKFKVLFIEMFDYTEVVQ